MVLFILKQISTKKRGNNFRKLAISTIIINIGKGSTVSNKIVLISRIA